MDYNYLANTLFPNVLKSIEEIENMYPQRNVGEKAIVTRMAPSPTGFVHLGNLVQGITSERMAHQSNGVLFLRVEDTDLKREVKGAVDILIESLKQYNIFFDEGATINGDNGIYGPYRQRQRAELYHVFAKELVKRGKAYPCFCTEEELAKMREKQQEDHDNFGYFGKYAVWRDRNIEDIEERLSRKEKWVLRFRSDGNANNKIKFTDLIKGNLELTENEMDIVLLKSDGIPTYHFAHAVDDHLMRTTHVVRGDEWLPSLPVHIQLFKALDFNLPKYLHIGPLMKMDGNSKRKLSKRKDPELGLSYYIEKGFPAKSVYEYVLTILNSNFEDWRKNNPDKDADEFIFSYKKMNPAGSLFDYAKLTDVSKNVISMMNAEEVYTLSLQWAEKFDGQLADLLIKDKAYAIKILSIGRGIKKPRKDISIFSEVKSYIALFYEELFEVIDSYPDSFAISDICDVLKFFRDSFDYSDEQQVWFDKIKQIAENIGFASDMKAYKENTQNYKGSIADVSMFIRIAVTGKINSPDLYTVMQILGENVVLKRIDDMISKL